MKLPLRNLFSYACLFGLFAVFVIPAHASRTGGGAPPPVIFVKKPVKSKK